MLQNVFFIDDDKPTTIINERLAKRSKLFEHTKVFNLSETALEYLKSIQNNIELLPCLIFLDINMPAFNGWDFLQEFNKLNEVPCRVVQCNRHTYQVPVTKCPHLIQDFHTMNRVLVIPGTKPQASGIM